ncbi:hypothetical protein CspeluHIS016_0700730 [Cutaneotrichosporon spelunceum]|uniref:ATP-dependent DNA ligase family profile domain-containing protein n=1 Tax=Cutaneotrichosporon spelunceum TaxID=1672016 RepID=A0AAD3TYE7_9TREE|nr:hypothetical protein CspeluHIS016_0700730 [Cutaneotrichosporon spelunceum]
MPPKAQPKSPAKQRTIASFFSPPQKRKTDVIEVSDSDDDVVVVGVVKAGKKPKLENGRTASQEVPATADRSNDASTGKTDAEEVEESDEALARRLAAEWEAADRPSRDVKGTTDKARAEREAKTELLKSPKKLHPMFARGQEAGPSPTIEPKRESEPEFKVKAERKPTLTATRPQPVDPIDFDTDSLLFRPAEVDISRWPAGRLPYSVLVGVYVQVAGTRSRLIIVRVLTNFIHLLLARAPLDLPPSLYLLSNHLRPAYIPCELGVGSMILSRAMKEVSGLQSRDLKRLWNVYGDPGDVAYEAKVQMRTLVEPAPLVVHDVYKRLLKMADIRGSQSGKLKGDVVRKLMVQARGEEVRYLVRTLIGNLRIGAVRLTLLTAVARAAALRATPDDALNVIPIPKKGKKAEDPAREAAEERCAEAVRLVRRVYVRHPNYGDLVCGIEDGGLEGLEARVPLSVGIPISPMLGSITRSFEEVYERLGSLPFTAEAKLDGQRLQMHVRRDGPQGEDDGGGRWVEDEKGRAWVRLFSRHLEDMTDKYPDVCARGIDLLSSVKGTRFPFPSWASTPTPEVAALLDAEEVTSLIVDAEIVAIDKETGAHRTFQELTNRARKDVRVEDIKVVVEVNAFDLMLVNDVPLLGSPFSLRRHLMRTLLPARPAPADPMLARWAHIDAVDSRDLKTLADLRAFFDKVVERKAEGLMVKLLESGGAPPDEEIAEIGDEEEEEAAEDKEECKDIKGRKKPLPATYEPDQRSMGWLKAKKDYLEGLGDSLDLVPVGAWWGMGRKAGWWSPILLAARNPETGVLEAVCKCISGFTDAFYKDLLMRYPPDSDPTVCSTQPLGYVETGGLVPDRWFLPREVWEIRGADITLSPVYPAAASYIGGERGLSLRFPRFIRVREDKDIEEATTPSLAQVDTVYSADSIEFCPLKGYERYFTCGTYQLLDPVTGELAPAPGTSTTPAPASEGGDAPAPRVGRLLLYSLDGMVPVETCRVETAAILDAKWSHTHPEISVADAKGALTRYALKDGVLEVVERVEVADEETLVLSLDHRPGAEEVITSLSSGELAHVAGGEVVDRWAAHDFEPWITAWQGPDTVWSGGDDLALKRWDIRMPGTATFVKRKGFDGGVTTIAPSPHDEHLLAVGSYDAHLRLFDARAPARPLLELEMPGGVWRTRWHPSPERKGDILNACMHGGFAVARIAEGAGVGEITHTFQGTLGYGADWCRLPPTDGGSLVATCSFYDHDMNVWRA